MASRFRGGNGTEKERRATESKGKANAKGARLFWESQVRSSRVVQVRRGSAEQSLSGGVVDDNDSDGGCISAMEIVEDFHQTEEVAEAEAAINKIIRNLRTDLENMHHEDVDISLRLASLQGEITSLEEEITARGYGIEFPPASHPPTPGADGQPQVDAAAGVGDDKEKSNSRQHTSQGRGMNEYADASMASAVKARQDSEREKHVATAVRFKRGNSYHDLQSARVVLKPIGPAESVDRLEWNKPHLWPTRAPAAVPRSASSTSSSRPNSTYIMGQGDSYDTSPDLSFESEIAVDADTDLASQRSSSAADSLSSASDTTLLSQEAERAPSYVTSPDNSLSSVSNVSSSVCTPLHSDSSLQSPDSGVFSCQSPTLHQQVSEDLRKRAVSGIHSDEIVAMYLEREKSIRSELGLMPKNKAKQSSLTRSFVRKQASVDSSPSDVPIGVTGSFRRSTNRVDGSIASSSSFRSSLRRRSSAHASQDPRDMQQPGNSSSLPRPKHHSTSVNTYC